MGTSTTACVLLLVSLLICTVSSAPTLGASIGTNSARYTATSATSVDEQAGIDNASSKSTVTSETRREYWKLKEISWDVVNENNYQPCHVSTARTFHKFILTREEVDHVNLFEFFIVLKNYTYDPFWNVLGLFYKPWLWNTLRNHHGRTLLMLPFNYDVLSLKTLAIDVEKTNLELTDSPFGCFGLLPTFQQVSAIRMILLNRIFNDKAPVNERLVCNQEIHSTGNYADFVHNCCYKDEENNITCTSNADEVWINRLYVAIMCIKVLLFLVSARFIPQKAYILNYHHYGVPFDDAPINLIVTKHAERGDADTGIRILNIPCGDDNSFNAHNLKFKKFRKFLEDYSEDSELQVRITKLFIKVKSRKIIAKYDTRLGMEKFFYNNLKKYKVISYFKAKYSKLKLSSSKIVKVIELMFTALKFAAMPFPFYIRLVFYYTFECEELNQRRRAMDANSLLENSKFYRTSFIQILTPLHELFLLTYIAYLLIVIVGISDFNFSNALKEICKKSLQDMNSVPEPNQHNTQENQTSVAKIIKQLIVDCLPDENTKLWKALVVFILIAPFYCVFVILSYTPLIYLTLKLIYEVFTIDGEFKTNKDPKPTFKKVGLLTDWISKIGKSVFMLFSLYSMAFLFSESIGFFIEVLAFAVMGIIINADNVLIYVSTVLLVFVYFYDCYSNIELKMGKFLINEFSNMLSISTAPESDEGHYRVKELQMNSQTRGSGPEKIKTDHIKNTKKNKIKLTLKKHMLFFDDSNTLRIPLRLFHKLCQDKIYGAPEQAIRILRNSTWQFLIIVLFLAYVMHVIIMFGKFYEMSSISSTLATVAGGMLPLLLKNIHTAKFGMINLKAVKLLRGHIKNIIDSFEHTWTIVDIEIEKHEVPEQAPNSNNFLAVCFYESKSRKKSRNTNNVVEESFPMCGAGRV